MDPRVQSACWRDTCPRACYPVLMFHLCLEGSVSRSRERVCELVQYSRLRELQLRALGYDDSSFGLHSLRAGGATVAANNGVPDRLFKRHGRWRSETAKDGYILDSEEAMLGVSRQLGIW